jgi:hypothetical protein
MAEPTSVNEAGGQAGFASFSVKSTPADLRELLKLRVAGGLAIFLWLLLAGIIVYHVYRISQLSGDLAALANSTEQKDHAEFVKQGIVAINDVAKTIYAFLTPVVGGVTAYFFVKSDQPSR